MLNSILVFLLSGWIFAGTANAAITQAEIQKVFVTAEKVYGQSLVNLSGEVKYPRSNSKGVWEVKPASDWTSGFFPGVLWLIYENNGREKWRQAAERYTKGLESRAQAGDHDIGFQILCSFGNGFRLTANPEYGKVIVKAGKTLASRFNPKVGMTKSWDWGSERWRFPVIIDNLMNLELLFKTAELTGDANYSRMALGHASRSAATHLRPDGGSYHVVDFDPVTGRVVKRMTHQGLDDESTWARGQAWGIYGFTIAARETGNRAFLDTALKMLAYDLVRATDDLVPYWDYDLNNPTAGDKDTSAAAIKAAALLELSRLDWAPKNIRLAAKNQAERVLESLVKKYLSEGENSGLLQGAIGNHPAKSEIGVSLVYADYYFLKALSLLKQ